MAVCDVCSRAFNVWKERVEWPQKVEDARQSQFPKLWALAMNIDTAIANTLVRFKSLVLTIKAQLDAESASSLSQPDLVVCSFLSFIFASLRPKGDINF